MGEIPFTLRLGTLGDLDTVRGLVRDAADWLRASKDTDQWERPWPDSVRHLERILNDLLKGKTWIVWDDTIAAATITIDADEPLDLKEQPIWPPGKRLESALYVRRVIVRRRYSGRGLGAALLNWAASAAERDHHANLIRVDVWTTNTELHTYYEGQRFYRCQGRDAQKLSDYPSQALFERKTNQSRSDHAGFFREESR